MSEKNLLNLLKKYFFLDYWKIGTSVYTYLNQTIFRWIADENFLNKLSTDFKIEIFKENDFKIWNLESVVFYKEESSSDSTYKQIIKFLHFLGILEQSPSRDKNKFNLSSNIFSKFKENGKIIREDIENIIRKEIFKHLSFYNKVADNFLGNINSQPKKLSKDTANNLEEIKNVILDKFCGSSDANPLISIIFWSPTNHPFKELINKFYKDDIKKKHVYEWDKLSEMIFKDEENKNSLNELMDKLNVFLSVSQKTEELVKSILYQTNSARIITLSDEENLYEKNDNIKNELVSSVLDIKSYFDFFYGGEKFKLPVFQRNYSWTTFLVEEFVNDLWENFLNKNRHYFINTIIFSSERSLGEKTNYWLVDGQQRTITLFLISFSIYKISINKNLAVHPAFYQMFKKESFILNKFENLKNFISFKYAFDLLGEGKEHNSKELNEKKDDDLEEKALVIQRNLELITNKLLEKIKNAIESRSFTEENLLKDFSNFFLHDVYINRLLIDIESPSILYEKLNLYSKPLTILEGVKNHIWEFLNNSLKNNKNPSEKKEKFIKEIIDTFEKSVPSLFSKDKKSDVDNERVKSFIEYIYFVKGLDSTNKKSLIDKFNHYIISVLSDKNILDTSEINFNKEAFLEDFKIYKFIIQDKKTIEEIEQEKEWTNISSFIYVITRGEKSVFTPLVWSILNKFSFFKTQYKQKSKIIHWLYEVERFIFNWKSFFFAGDSLTKYMLEIANKVKMGKINSPEELRSSLLSLPFVPQKIHFNKEMISLKKNKIKLIWLWRIEWFLINDLSMIFLKDDDHNLNIYQSFIKTRNTYEHIWPKNPKNDINKQEYDQYDHKIELLGNGLPLSKGSNSKIGNKNSDKKIFYYDEQFNDSFKLYNGYENILMSLKHKDTSVDSDEDSKIIKEGFTFDKIEKRTEELYEILRMMYEYSEEELKEVEKTK